MVYLLSESSTGKCARSLGYLDEIPEGAHDYAGLPDSQFQLKGPISSRVRVLTMSCVMRLGEWHRVFPVIDGVQRIIIGARKYIRSTGVQDSHFGGMCGFPLAKLRG